MPNTQLEDAIIEAFATAKSSEVYYDTLEISHPAVEDPLYLVAAHVDLDFTVDGVPKTFTGSAFRLTLPATGENGTQELGIVLDNVTGAVTDFLNLTKEVVAPITIKYRPYLGSDRTTCMLKTPLTLYLTDVIQTAYQVSGRATFSDIINRKFPAQVESYLSDRFPGLS